VISKIEFSVRNLTSNAGLFLLLEHTGKNGIFYLIDHDLVFENASTNKIKMNHIKTLICGSFKRIQITRNVMKWSGICTRARRST
jgi:hypothetical protein